MIWPWIDREQTSSFYEFIVPCWLGFFSWCSRVNWIFGVIPCERHEQHRCNSFALGSDYMGGFVILAAMAGDIASVPCVL